MTNQENEPNDTPIELTDKQRAFVIAYFACNGNGTRAWLKLHPDVKYESAKAQASETLTNINIKAEIKRIWTERAMDGEEAVARMAAKYNSLMASRMVLYGSIFQTNRRGNICTLSRS